MLNHKPSINDRCIMDFLMLSLMSGVAGIPPRRSQDWSMMKIRTVIMTEKRIIIMKTANLFSTFTRLLRCMVGR